MAERVREALEEKLATHRPAPRSLGMGASGHSDTARPATGRPAPVLVGGERAGFTFDRPEGKHHRVMRSSVAPA
jgi:hypothetical protein